MIAHSYFYVRSMDVLLCFNFFNHMFNNIELGVSLGEER